MLKNFAFVVGLAVLVAFGLSQALAQTPAPVTGAPVASAAIAAPVTVVAPVTATIPPTNPEAVVDVKSVPSPDENMGEFSSFVKDAFTAKNWGLVTCGILMFLIWLAAKLFKLPSNILPLLAAGSGVLASVAALVSVGTSWYEAIFNGIFLGGGASILWSNIGKLVLKKPEKKVVK